VSEVKQFCVKETVPVQAPFYQLLQTSAAACRYFAYT